MKIKNISTGLVSIFFILSVFICACQKTTISKGGSYHHEKLGVEITPPTGWKVLDLNNPFVDGIAFYPVNSKNARLYINSKTKLTEDNLPIHKRRTSLDDHVNEYREKSKKLSKSLILKDKKDMLNSIPAHVIKTSYTSEEGIPAKNKQFYFKHNNRFYVVGYWIFKDRDYQKNLALVKDSLKTFGFKK